MHTDAAFWDILGASFECQTRVFPKSATGSDLRILHDTSDRMVIEHGPWKLGVFFALLSLAFLAGAVFSIVSGDIPAFLATLTCGLITSGLMVTFVGRYSLTLDKPSKTAEIRQTRIGRKSRTTLPLDGVETIDTETLDGSSRLILVLVDEPTPLPVMPYHIGGSQVGAVAEKAQNWLVEARD